MSVADIICISLLVVLILLVTLFIYVVKLGIRSQVEEDNKINRILSALERQIDDEVFPEFKIDDKHENRFSKK